MSHRSAHKYREIKLPSGKKIYRCMLPLCTHYVIRELAIGAITLCWGKRCNRNMVMTPSSLYKRVRPLCPNCIIKGKKRNQDVVNQINANASMQDILETFGVGVKK